MKVIYTEAQKELIKRQNLAYDISESVSDYWEDYTIVELENLAKAKIKRITKKHSLEDCEKVTLENEEGGNGTMTISYETGH